MSDPRAKDFYKILGVSETASAEDIKKSYRRLAKKLHPDVNAGDKAKESKFKDVSEAYETIGDEKKRAEYDAARRNPFAGGGGRSHPGGGPGGGFSGGFPGGGGGRVHVDFNEMFSRGARRPRGVETETQRETLGDIFGDLFNFGGRGGEGQPQQHGRGDGRDIAMQTEVDFATAALGGDHSVTSPSGRITVRIPPGIEDGQTVRVAGRGEAASTKKGAAGDLLLEIHVRPHPTLRRKGQDVEVDVHLPIDVAILGGKVEVPTLEGKPLQLTIPAGTSSGVRMRLKGKGIPLRDTTARGDLYAVIAIDVPKDLPQPAKDLIAEFAKLTKK